ncbi:MAG TPA: tyrosine-type recombinase/integrase [Polyangiaceae bacterium]|nr:tyrosine-type recombinase/integrase [Polyangiaceae bacterium]
MRFGTKQQRRFRIPITDQRAASARATALVELGQTIGKAGIDPELGASLLTKAGAADATGLAKIKAAVAKLASGVQVKKKDAESSGKLQTFEDLGRAWTSGKLNKQYPDHVKLKRSADRDEDRLTHLYKTIGKVQLRAFSLADAKRAMAALPKAAKTSATRRQYAQLIAKVLNYAAWPCELIPHSPLPRGFLPKVKSTKATAYLYPAEDAALMASKKVPLARRMLYGFLAREGLRLGEALSLRWADIDLERAAIKLDENKSDDPRAWALSPGIAEALAAFRPEGAEDTDLVFSGLESRRMAEGFRDDLEAAEVGRPELLARTANRQPIRVHDLRATFVTLSLAAGRSETWVADRTGHKSSVMINRYRRAARTAAELDLGTLLPLNQAVKGLPTRKPELSQRLSQTA